MISLNDIIEYNKYYDSENERLNTLLKTTKVMNDEYNMDEILTLPYDELKSFYDIIEYRHNNNEKFAVLKKIMEDKKIQKYPEIKGIHYYPILKSIDFLSEEEKISLDTMLKKIKSARLRKDALPTKNEKLMQFLIDNKVIERIFTFKCGCDEDDCLNTYVTETEFNKYKEYWEDLMMGVTTPEEDSKMDYGCFWVGCENDRQKEISCLEEFNSNISEVDYKIVMNPDLTYDEL